MLKRRRRNKLLFSNRNISFPIILIFGVLILLFNDMGIVKWYQLHKKKKQMISKINYLILEEKKILNKIDRLENNDEYIKKFAQEHFQLVKPGEKVFRVIDKRKSQ